MHIGAVHVNLRAIGKKDSAVFQNLRDRLPRAALWVVLQHLISTYNCEKKIRIEFHDSEGGVEKYFFKKKIHMKIHMKKYTP